MGSSLFWFDNWTGLWALYFLVPQVFRIDESIRNVNDVVEDGMWNVEKIQEALPMEFAMNILERIKPPVMENKLDIPYWMLQSRGNFSVKSA